jgi:hypothetical protein
LPREAPSLLTDSFLAALPDSRSQPLRSGDLFVCRHNHKDATTLRPCLGACRPCFRRMTFRLRCDPNSASNTAEDAVLLLPGKEKLLDGTLSVTPASSRPSHTITTTNASELMLSLTTTVNGICSLSLKKSPAKVRVFPVSLTILTSLDGKNRLYFIENDKCTVKEVEPMREACVHENHHEERKLIIGGTLHARWFGFTTQERQRNMIVSEHECIPVEGSFLEHHNRHYQFDGAVQFWNIRHGIGNPIIFEIPHMCRK